MKQLKDPCKSAIANGWCLGCQAMEDENFIGNPNCRFNKRPTSKESINSIFKNLGVDRNVR